MFALYTGDAGEPIVIRDAVDIVKNLPDRWTGETHFELLPDPQPAKKVKTPARRGEKRKADKEIDKKSFHRSSTWPTTTLTGIASSTSGART